MTETIKKSAHENKNKKHSHCGYNKPRIDYGVYMRDCSDDFILDSNVSDCEYGIYIDDTSAHTMSGNTIYGSSLFCMGTVNV